MIKDKALEELFLTQRPHFDDHDAFMDVLTHRLDAVEYLKQHQDTTIRRYKLVMIVAFIVGILSGAVTMAFVLSTPFDVSLFNFHVHTGFLLELSEISRPIVAAALALLMTVGIISLISNIQDINNIMNMNKKTIITMMLALVTVAGQAQIHYRLEGNIGRPDLTDTLSIVENRGFEKDGNILSETIDTLYIVNGNIVPIEGTLPESVTVTAMNKTLSTQLVYIMLTDGTTRINGTLNDFVVRQSGNPLADAMNQMEEDRLQLTKEITDLTNSGEPIDTTALIAREDSFVVSILKAHPNDQIGVVCMLDHADDICILSPRRGIELIDMLDSTLVAKEPKLKGKKRDLQTRISTSEGAMFRDFTAEYDGKQQRLSDYVGRGLYVLVDFWASWCGPCREEIPNIVAAYSKYKDKGLQVVGVASLEESERSLEYVREQNIPYPQIFNVGMPVLQLYGIDGIPCIFLFAPDGTILARGLRGVDIDKKLKEIFNDNK